LYNAIQVLCEKGNEVILASPYWVSYLEMIKLSGAKPVIIKTREKDAFKITPETLLKKITPRSRVLILNSPANPTGTVYSAAEIEALARIISDRDITVISDEIYEKLIYSGAPPVSIASLSDKLKSQTIVINGVSKTYAMTGWRIGYAAGPQDVIQAMTNLQDHSTSNPVSFVQKAAVVALNGPQQEVEKMRQEFQKRRDYMVSKINSLKKISCRVPEGAFYVFANVSKLYGKTINGIKIEGSLSLAESWLNEAKVAVIPGVAFGDDDHVRFSYATSMAKIQTGLARIEDFINKHY
jgi:aspartate aminotransferase